MLRKRILILTLSFGAGHVMASEAIAESLRRLDRDAEVRVLDCIRLSSLAFRWLYVWPYWMMIRYAPSLWGRLFRARQEKQHQQTAPMWLFRWGCRRVFEEIKMWRPEVIVATEVGACEIASIAIRRGLSQATLLAVATDHEFEPVWVRPEVDRHFVPTTTVAQQLAGWGVEAARIEVSGIPVLEKFHHRCSAASAKERLQLPADCPMILVMGGGMGPLRMDQIVRALTTLPGPLSIVAIAGWNSKMRRRLERMRPAMPSNTALKVFGWTDGVDQLMRAADVLVTKPGGMTLTEAACVGLPMVCVNPIPGPEEVHCRLIEREQLGAVARSIQEIPRLVENHLHAGRKQTPEWLIHDAADRIAACALEKAAPLRLTHVASETAPQAIPRRDPLHADSHAYETELSSQ